MILPAPPGYQAGYQARYQASHRGVSGQSSPSPLCPSSSLLLKLLTARRRGWQGAGTGRAGVALPGCLGRGRGAHTCQSCLWLSPNPHHLPERGTLYSLPTWAKRACLGSQRQVLSASTSPVPWTCAPPPAAPYLGRGAGQPSCFSFAPRPWPPAPGLEVVGTVGFRVRPSDTLSGPSGLWSLWYK